MFDIDIYKGYMKGEKRRGTLNESEMLQKSTDFEGKRF